MIHSKRINLFKPSKFITHYFFLLRRLYPNNPSTAVADARAVVAKIPTCVLVPVFVPLFLLGFSNLYIASSTSSCETFGFALTSSA